MNYIIIAFILLTLVAAAFLFKKHVSTLKGPRSFVKLDGDTNKHGLLPLVSKNWLTETKEKFANIAYDKYKNEHYELSNKLCNEIYTKYSYWERGESHFDFLSKLSDAQKMYFALINFEGQINNGGVYQFLFNQPECAILALEAMKYAKLDKLATDYEKVLKQFFGKFDSIEALRNKFQNKYLGWDKRWNSFAEGYEELSTAEVIENYFYDEEYAKKFHAKMTQYVYDNKDQLMKFN